VKVVKKKGTGDFWMTLVRTASIKE
jgi:hypothetical protein